MKRLLAMSIFLAVLAMGCKKDDNDVTPGMTAKIDGESWKATTTLAIYSKSLNVIQITGMQGVMEKTIQIQANGYKTGTYNFSNTELGASGVYTLNTGMNGVYSSFMADTPVGKMVITELDTVANTISGSFNFEGYNEIGNKIVITEGVFTKIGFEKKK